MKWRLGTTLALCGMLLVGPAAAEINAKDDTVYLGTVPSYCSQGGYTQSDLLELAGFVTGQAKDTVVQYTVNESKKETVTTAVLSLESGVHTIRVVDGKKSDAIWFEFDGTRTIDENLDCRINYHGLTSLSKDPVKDSNPFFNTLEGASVFKHKQVPQANFFTANALETDRGVMSRVLEFYRAE